jgi:peptide/nickel transport system permease protein
MTKPAGMRGADASGGQLIGVAELLAPSPATLLRRRIWRHWGLLIGGVILITIAAVALLAPLLSVYDPYDQQPARKLIPPIWQASAKATWQHPLGTDQLGRDYLTRLFYGARISLLIGISAMLIAGVIGTALGVLAGYFGGRIDMLVGFIVTTRLSMPVVLLALAVVAIIGSSLAVVIWVLGLLIWDRFAVVMRSATQQVRARIHHSGAGSGLLQPAHTLDRDRPQRRQSPDRRRHTRDGAGHPARGRPVVPGSWGTAADPIMGLMISQAKGLMFFDPWLISIPGAALFLMVLAINLVGDGLRDVTAPENRS